MCTCCSSKPIGVRFICNDQNYTNFKLAEYAVKEYSNFFVDDSKEIARFNDSFNSIIYSGKNGLYTDALDKFMYILSKIIWCNIQNSKKENALNDLVKYRCELLDTAMDSINKNFPYYKDEYISINYNRLQLFKLIRLIEETKIYYDNNEDEYAQYLVLVNDIVKQCPFVYIKTNYIFELTQRIYDNIKIDKGDMIE